MEEFEATIKSLLDGKVVPITGKVNLQTKSALSQELERPIVKRTITYIVMAMVFDDRGRVLLIQEAKQSCHGQWYAPAGRMEPGENLVDAVKREVLEEAGVEFEPLSVISLQLQWSFSWVRICYVGRATGGQLKTLEQQDSESLQAGWFSVSHIKSGQLKLRYKDFFRSMDLAEQYLGLSPDKRHPLYSVGIQPHHYITHRPLILRKGEEGSIEVLCNISKGRLPCCAANPHDSLSATVGLLFTEVFNLKSSDGFPKLKLKGLLTVEHCGVPAREHDGICISTVFKLARAQRKRMDKPTNTDYAWVVLTNSDVIDQLNKRVLSKDQLLIPII